MTDKEKRVTIIEQLKKLDEQRAGLIAGAKDEALKKADAAIADLNALGFSYQLVEGGKATRKKGTGPRQKSEVCSICKFATDPPHDGRLKFHRDQGDAKRPLTDKQLGELGLKKK